LDNDFDRIIENNPLFRPSYLGFLLPTLILGIVLIWMEPLTIPLIQIALIVEYKLVTRVHKARLKLYSQYLKTMIENVQRDNHYAIAHMRVGIGMFNGQGLLQWYNNTFQEIIDRSQILGYTIESLLPIQKGFFEVMAKEEQVFQTLEIGDKIYTMQSRKMLEGASSENSTSGVSIYLYDTTELTKVRRKYTDNKLALCYIRCDNYDEVIRTLSDSGTVSLNSDLSGMLTKWAKTNNGFIVHLSNELALVGFTHKDISEIVKNKFDILDQVHLINANGRMSPTLSIGVAMDGDSLNDQLEKASDAMDMALNRGGDQVVVNTHDRLSYFGATGLIVATKANRVRARIIAQTLQETMEKASHVLVMGHANEDLDSIGSAIGIAAMARFAKKPVHIILSSTGGEYQHSKTVIQKYIESNPYDDLIVTDEDEVQKFIDDKTLLILVDHHRKQLCAMPSLLNKIPQRILIDHHRRSEDIIENLTSIYQEPSSSSTSEMVTELLPYFDEDIELTPYEASMLYMGIVLDSRNFTTQTNERTFEAAAFLKRFGANIPLVNEVFSDTFNDLKYRSKLIADAKFLASGFAVATNTAKEKNSKIAILSAQAADELILSLGVHGSCIITQYEDTGLIAMSARSDGKIFNVQTIMEALGGGGHQNMAACQINNKTIEEATELLLNEVNKQLEE